MKNVLGLDLGTNSIGWAKVSMDDDGKYLHDIKLGSRIIPMSQDVISDFDKGKKVSQTALRRGFRGGRRLRERCLLRRERLHRVLHVLSFLPEHYDRALGWDKDHPTTYGKFLDDSESKLVWIRTEDDHYRFLFMDSFHEMLADFAQHQPQLVADGQKIPLDWTLYYLRKKALSQPILKEELAWILLNFNQKRGYYQLRGKEEGEDQKKKGEDQTKKEEYYELKVVRVEETGEPKGSPISYVIYFENGWFCTKDSITPLHVLVGQNIGVIATWKYEKDGKTLKKNKDGSEQITVKIPKEDDWGAYKKRTEKQLETSGQTVGCFIYDHLLAEPSKGGITRCIKTENTLCLTINDLHI